MYSIIDNINSKLDVYIMARNILDSRYYNLYVGNEEGMKYTPQDPIRLTGGVNFNF